MRCSRACVCARLVSIISSPLLPARRASTAGILLLGSCAGVRHSRSPTARASTSSPTRSSASCSGISIVYVTLIVRTFGSRGRGEQSAGTAAVRSSGTVSQDGFFRRWLARLYANRVRARIDALITHSIGFNAPLAPGLRRFAADWCEVGRPLFRERARRLLHLAAILAAVGLMAGYDLRGWVLRQAAGWSTTVFGPCERAHRTRDVVRCRRPRSRVCRSRRLTICRRWPGPSSATGGGTAGQWLYLIDWTALALHRPAAPDRRDRRHRGSVAPLGDPAHAAARSPAISPPCGARSLPRPNLPPAAQPDLRTGLPSAAAALCRNARRLRPASNRTRTPRGTGWFCAPWPIGNPAAQGRPVAAASSRSTSALEKLASLLLAAGELAEDDAAHLAEHAREREVGPHPVEPIRPLADVLEEEDGALERCEKGRAEEPRQHGEVAAERADLPRLRRRRSPRP